MTSPRDPLFDQRIADWLETDPDHAPAQALDVILAAVPSIPQRHASRVPWRFQTMTTPLRLATAAVIGVLVVGGTFYLTRPDRPAVGGPTPEPTASQTAIVPASPSTNPSLAVVSPSAPTWTATGGMIVARTGHTATLLPDGRVLVAGGFGRDPVSLNSAELYDPGSGTWTATGFMHGAREGHTATLLRDGTVLVAGGSSSNGGYASATAELYDPVSGTWTATADMFVAGSDHTATLLSDGKVLVVGGDRGPQRAVLYDPGSGTWTATGFLATRRFRHTATLLSDGRVLVVGGNPLFGLKGTSSAELYDPSSGSWTAAGNLGQLREAHTATLLLDGTVLVTGCGGQCDGDKPTAKAELYDPTSGSWTVVGNMVEISAGGWSTTLLPDGRVLVAGGSSATGALASAELYDPGSRTWTSTGNMTTARSGQTATLLPGGQVLVAGGESGIGGSFGLLASAELYQPGNGN